MTNSIQSVSELTRGVKALLEGAYPFVWVRGQVTNVSRPGSGHVYFSLKDEDASLAAVWFRGSQKTSETFDPLTGEVYEDGPRPGLAGRLENGQEIVCAGRLSVYGPRGVYQLVVELAQEAGQGRLQAEFERLKLRLAEKGYFAQERKRVLPRHPGRVAVITAVTGAAVRDFLRMAHERGWGGEIRVYPVPVQGEEAPAAIARALGRVNGEGWAEVAVLIRGGGSLEDLWAFNTEVVATAVFMSGVPVLAGIGHEVDVSIADLVADVRAATPTHAAQLLWVERRELAQRLDEAEMALSRVWGRYLERREARLARLAGALGWLSPLRSLDRLEERRAGLRDDLHESMLVFLDGKEGRLREFFFRMTQLTAARRQKAEEELEGLVRRMDAAGPARELGRLEERLEGLVLRLRAGMGHSMERLSGELEKFLLRLESANPALPLERGYVLARKRSGEFLRSVAGVRPGDALDIVALDGEVTTIVERVKQSGRKITSHSSKRSS